MNTNIFALAQELGDSFHDRMISQDPSCNELSISAERELAAFAIASAVEELYRREEVELSLEDWLEAAPSVPLPQKVSMAGPWGASALPS